MKFDVTTLKPRYAYLAIVIVGFALYGQTLFFSYTHFDDYRLIVLNYDFISRLSNIPKLFQKDVFTSLPSTYLYFRPMLSLSFMLDAQIGGDAPAVYHLTNLLLHLACACLVFVLINKLSSRRLLALIGAIFFTVHPLFAYAVAWIPGRNDSLLTLFVLGSFIFLLRFLEGRKGLDFLFHIVLLAFALLTKETAVLLPVLALVYIMAVRHEHTEKTDIVKLVVAWGCVIGLWMYARSMIGGNHVTGGFIIQILSNAPALLIYLGKAIFPVNLTVLPNVTDDTLWWGVGTLAVLAILVSSGGEKNIRLIGWGFLWYFLFLIPSLVSADFVPDHRAYCPMVGFFIAVFESPLLKRFTIRKIPGVAIVALFLAAFVVASFLQSRNFRDREAFCLNGYQNSPSVDRAYEGLAGMFLDQGNYELAEKIILQGLIHNDKLNSGHRMLGDIYVRKGFLDSAEKEYKAALVTDSLDLQAYVNYGRMCLEQGRLDETERLWKKPVAIQPDYFLGYYLLANFFLLQRDDPDTATLYVREMEKRGIQVMPELLSAIAQHSKNRRQDKMQPKSNIH